MGIGNTALAEDRGYAKSSSMKFGEVSTGFCALTECTGVFAGTDRTLIGALTMFFDWRATISKDSEGE